MVEVEVTPFLASDDFSILPQTMLVCLLATDSGTLEAVGN
jgi:hypothetical protein